MTLYDAQTRSDVQTDQDKAALRSLFELKDIDTSKPVDLYFGPTAPKDGESFDGSWKPNDIEEIK